MFEGMRWDVFFIVSMMWCQYVEFDDVGGTLDLAGIA